MHRSHWTDLILFNNFIWRIFIILKQNVILFSPPPLPNEYLLHFFLSPFLFHLCLFLFCSDRTSGTFAPVLTGAVTARFWPSLNT